MKDAKHYGFFKVPNELLMHEVKPELSESALLLFVVLCFLRNRFHVDTSESSFTNPGYQFYRTDELLARDCGISLRTLKRAKAELRKHPELVKISNTGYVTDEHGSRATCYSINDNLFKYG